MEGIKKAQMGIIAVLAVMLVSMTKRLPATRKLSSGITTLILAGIVLLVAAGSVSALPACPAPGNADISASCELTQDYTVTTAGQYGYKIIADNVVIDGKGFTITGTMPAACGGGEAAPCTCAGVINYDFDNVVVKDMGITNFCTGVVMGDNDATDDVVNMTVTGCKIHNCGESTGTTHGIHLVRANDCTISKNEIYEIDGTGTDGGCGGGGNGIFGYGADWDHGNYCSVTCNYLHDNTKSGAYIKKMCHHWTFSYNNASANLQGGIAPMCKKSSYTMIEYNIMTGNGAFGYNSQASYNTLRFNTITNNGNFGIIFTSDQYSSPAYGMNNEAYNNTVCGHTVKDMYLSGNDGGTNKADSNTCDNSDIAGACDWNCDNPVSVYFDFDNDGYYSDDPVNCSCTNPAGGKCACCNPGLFNGSNAAEASYKSSCDCQFGTPGPDPNDCDAGITSAKPDLIVEDVEAVSWDLAARTYYLNYTVKNQGILDAGASRTNVTNSTGEISNESTSALPIGNSEEKQVGPFTLSGNSETITVCADCIDDVDELDETNNCKPYTVNYPAVNIYVDPQLTNIAPQDQFDINIKIDPNDIPIYGVEYYLTYNTSIVRAESQVKGPFLGTSSDTIVVVNDIDRTSGTVSYAETRKASGGVTEANISSVIQFTAIGPADNCTGLNLSGVIIVKEDDKTTVTYKIENGTVCITDNIAPVASGCSKHRINNVQKKFECLAQLCSNSHDDDGDKTDGGGKIVYIRWAFGDGEYGTSEGLGECPCKYHSYISWIWEPFGVSYDDGGRYVPFNVSLTVTDNGDPQLEDETKFNVTVYMAGDTNGDGVVNIIDAVYIGLSWDDKCEDSTTYCQNLWDSEQSDAADLNNDCEVNILDAVIVGTMWGHEAWYPV